MDIRYFDNAATTRIKEEVLEEKKQNSNPEEFKQVKSNNGKHAKLSPAATVLLTIAATLGMIVLGTAVYALITLIK